MVTKKTYHNLMKTNLLLRTLPGLMVALCSVMSVQVRAGERAIVKYPRYVLIDLGTLGGPNSGQVRRIATLHTQFCGSPTATSSSCPSRRGSMRQAIIASRATLL